MSCEATIYGDCYGICKDIAVTLLYRDKYGYVKPDEIVQVTMCNQHYTWLDKIQKHMPLEMRGEVAEYSIHEDLFSPFTATNRIYTLLTVDIINTELVEEKQQHLLLVQSRNVAKFRDLLMKSDKNITSVFEEGMFQTTFQYNEADKDSKEVVIEVKPIHGENEFDALSSETGVFYRPFVRDQHQQLDFDDVQFQTIQSEYGLELIPECIRKHFESKKLSLKFENFKECLNFIDCNIEPEIIGFYKFFTRDEQTLHELFTNVTNLTEALIDQNHSFIEKMNSAGDITADVLWVTYVSANHKLFKSLKKENDLSNNEKLIELFIARGLHKKLLILAISGERVRGITSKIRDSHNILFDNEFVVRKLVPKHVSVNEPIYAIVTDDTGADTGADTSDTLTPLQYWHHFSNQTFDFNECFAYSRHGPDVFDKNDSIRVYLEIFI
jgi:hypothetical protein